MPLFIKASEERLEKPHNNNEALRMIPPTLLPVTKSPYRALGGGSLPEKTHLRLSQGHHGTNFRGNQSITRPALCFNAR